MNITKYFAIGLLSSSFALFSATSLAKESSSVATVNGHSISKEVLDNYLEIVNRSRGDKVDPATALDDLIVTQLAYQQAKKDGVQEREHIKRSIEEATKKIILNAWMSDKKDSLKITDDEIKAAYDEAMKGQDTKEFKARHILVKTEEDAKKIIESLNKDSDFEKLAKEKSTGPSSSTGGDLGWFTARTMVPPFAKAIKAMKKGDISKAPVKTNFGWHVIKLEDTREAKLPNLKSLEAQIKRGIEQDKLLSFIDSLKESADIKINLPKEVKETDKADNKK